MDYFVCPMDMTTTYQTVMTPDGGCVRIENRDFAKMVVNMAENFENFKIQLLGNQEYCQEYADRIKEEELFQNGLNKMEVKVN